MLFFFNQLFYIELAFNTIIVRAETPPTIANNDVFSGVSKTIPVYVPCGSLEAYQSAAYWNAFTNIQEVCTQTQTVTLTEGWNWFSTYIEADDLLEQLEDALGENGISIESRNDGMTEFDGEDWFGDLDDVGITNEQMFLIQTSAACTIQLNGIPANVASHPITINPGWNWIGFPCSHEVSIADAFAGFEAEEGDQLESKADYTEYDGEDWFGEIETLTPGQGYLYYSNSDVPKTFTFPVSAK